MKALHWPTPRYDFWVNPPSASHPSPSPPTAGWRSAAGTLGSVAYGLGCLLLLWLQPRGLWTVAAFLLPCLVFVSAWLWRRGWRLAAVAVLLGLPAALWASHGWWGQQAQLLYVAEYVAVYATLSAWFASSLGSATPVITRVARRVHPLTPDMRAYTVRLTRGWAIYFAAMAALSVLTYALLGLRAWAFFTLVLSPISLGAFVVGEHFLRYHWHPDFARVSLRQTVRSWRQGSA